MLGFQPTGGLGYTTLPGSLEDEQLLKQAMRLRELPALREIYEIEKRSCSNKQHPWNLLAQELGYSVFLALVSMR
jgi:hypothetical protein